MSLNFLGFIKNYPACRPAAYKKLLQSQLGGPSGIFQYLFCRKTPKNEGGDFGEKLEKSLPMPKKTESGDPLVSPGIVFYAEKEENPFWFSSLGQMIQFGTINFAELSRTILVSSCELKKRHYYSRFQFMKRRLKIVKNHRDFFPKKIRFKSNNLFFFR